MNCVIVKSAGVGKDKRTNKETSFFPSSFKKTSMWPSRGIHSRKHSVPISVCVKHSHTLEVPGHKNEVKGLEALSGTFPFWIEKEAEWPSKVTALSQGPERRLLASIGLLPATSIRDSQQDLCLPYPGFQ